MTVRGTSLALACLLALMSASSAAQAGRPGDAALVAAYEEFRALFADERFAEALPLAQRVVAMTESADTRSDQLPIAYNNLGVVQMRVGDLDAAEASFRHALDLLEGRVGIVSRRLIAPLAGLGAVHAARGHSALAADVLQRALAISRRANGLFNVDQMELLDSLIDNYAALGNNAGVEREARYAVRILQQEHGPDDPRTIPAVMRLAELYESTGHYVLARAQWQRVVAVASREGDRNAATVLGLVGVSRTHRLQFLLDPESIEAAQVPIDPWTGRPDPFMERALGTASARLDREGEAAALQALAILDQTPDPPRRLLALTLTEVGDWFMTAGRADRALPYYRRAWPLFVATVTDGERNPLAAPRALRYRPPAAAVRDRDRSDVAVVATPFQFSMSIGADGEVSNVTLVSADAEAYRAAQFLRALRRALFSPRFEDGEPVATDEYQFTETWYDAVIAPTTQAEGEPQPEGKAPGS